MLKHIWLANWQNQKPINYQNWLAMLFSPLPVLFYSFMLTEGKSEWFLIPSLINK